MKRTRRGEAWSKEENGDLIEQEFDVRVTKRGEILCKVLLFKNVTTMRKYIRLFGYKKSRIAGAMTVDVPVGSGSIYYAVIHLPMDARLEHVAHEAAHAGFSYSARMKRLDVFPGAKQHPEENVCYPAGRITEAIWSILSKEKG